MDATPWKGSERPDMGGASMILTVNVTLRGSHSGEEEIEYCLTLIEGSSNKNVANGRLISGYSSRMSKIEIRLASTLSAYDAESS